MPRKTDPFDTLLEEWPPELAREFLKAIEEINDPSRVRISEIVRLLEAGDADGVLRYLGIDRLKFQGLEIAMRNMFEAGGIQFSNNIPTLAKVIFDVRNLNAERWVRDKSSELITEIVDDQREMVRTSLTEGLARGDNPRTTALDLVGTINRKTGKREGGVLGLTMRQEEWARNYAKWISSSDPKELKKALDYKLRDKRFDRSIKAAIREGKPIPAATRAKMLAAFRNRALKYRADVIGRTETLHGLNASKHEAYRQAIERGEVRADQITKEWDSAGDLRVRPSHNILNGQIKPFNEAFISPDTGRPMMFPTDTSLKARGADTIQCRCKCRYEVSV